MKAGAVDISAGRAARLASLTRAAGAHAWHPPPPRRRLPRARVALGPSSPSPLRAAAAVAAPRRRLASVEQPSPLGPARSVRLTSRPAPRPLALAVKLSVDAAKMVEQMETPAELDFSKFEGKLEPGILAAVKAIAEEELAAAQAALAEDTEFAELEKEVQDAFNGLDGLLELDKTEETQAEAGMANVVVGMKKLAVDIESVKGVTIAEISSASRRCAPRSRRSSRTTSGRPDRARSTSGGPFSARRDGGDLSSRILSLRYLIESFLTARACARRVYSILVSSVGRAAAWRQNEFFIDV